MKTQCPACLIEQDVPDPYKGRTVKCAKCKQPFTVKEHKPLPPPPISTAPTNENVITRKDNGPKSKSKNDFKVKCPKCSCSSITTIKEGYSAGSGCCGAILFGPLGLLCGASGANRLYSVCQNCGYKWKL